MSNPNYIKSGPFRVQSLEKSKIRFFQSQSGFCISFLNRLIQDHYGRGASKEPKNPPSPASAGQGFISFFDAPWSAWSWIHVCLATKQKICFLDLRILSWIFPKKCTLSVCRYRLHNTPNDSENMQLVGSGATQRAVREEIVWGGELSCTAILPCFFLFFLYCSPANLMIIMKPCIVLTSLNIWTYYYHLVKHTWSTVIPNVTPSKKRFVSVKIPLKSSKSLSENPEILNEHKTGLLIQSYRAIFSMSPVNQGGFVMKPLAWRAGLYWGAIVHFRDGLLSWIW